MADKTKIEWTEATWNPIRARNLETGGVGHFCVHASPGCQNCYSEAFQPRFGNPVRFAAQDAAKVEVFLDEKALTQPLRWQKPRHIFVCSMTDLFGEFVSDEMIDRVFAVMALCPQHTFQVLTKRSARMREYVTANRWQNIMDEQYDLQASGLTGDGPPGEAWPLPNVWLGVSVEDQRRADERVPDLLATPAAVRWLSCEPLLGPVDLTNIAYDGVTETNALSGVHLFSDVSQGTRLDWIVVGGESGRNARPMHPDWARSLRDQCAAAASSSAAVGQQKGVPYFFKQWGEWGPDTGPDGDLDRDGLPRDRVMEGAGPCRVFVGGDWREYPSGYAVPIELCTGHGEFVYRLGKRRNGRQLDGAEHNAMPEQANG